MKMDLKFVIVSFLIPLVSAESCSLQNIPQFVSQTSGGKFLGNIQAIVPSYTFNCTGRVVQWGAYIEGGDEHYNIEFQVWRQSETGNTSYSLVGSNCFSGTAPDSSQTSLIRQNVPSEEMLISVLPDDVVGFRFRYVGDEDPVGVQLNSAETSVVVWYVDQQGLVENEMSRRNTETQFVDIGDYKSVAAAPVITALVEFITPVIPIQPTTSATPTQTTSPTETISISTETPIVLANTVSSEQQFLQVSTTPLVSSDVTNTPAVAPSPTPPAVTPSPTPPAVAPSSTPPAVAPSPTPPAVAPSPTPPAVAPSPTPPAVAPSPTPPAAAPSPTSPAVEPTPNGGEEQNPEDPSNTTGDVSASNKGATIGIVIGVLFFIIAILVVLVIVLAIKLKSITRDKGAQTIKFKLMPPKSESLEDTRVIMESQEYEYNYSLLRESAPTSRDSSTNGYSIVRLTANPSITPATAGGEYDYVSENGHVYQTIQSESPTDTASNYSEQLIHRQSAKYAELTPLPHQADIDASEPIGPHVPTEEERIAAGGHHYEMTETHEYHKLKFFVEDQTYWAPASTTSGLYAQLAAKKYREIPIQQILRKGELGSGQFGQVRKGVWRPENSGASLEIAVKTLKIDAPESDKVKFLQEAAIMGQFSHPNVVRLYGLVTINTPNMIVLEYMSNGDLRTYIRGIDTNQYPVGQIQHQFLRFMREAAAGMAYLSEKDFVHRDLAARNILLDQKFTCKIGDFGLARDLMHESYYISKGGQIPVKWTAPEALFYKKYSPASDVWSYGMVLFEIWSLGRKPFSNLSNAEVVDFVRTGYCQPPPPGCPRAVYKLMVDCWNPTHYERPTFASIGAYLKEPDQTLLALAEDGHASKKARELGAPISESRNLFLALQHQYKEQT